MMHPRLIASMSVLGLLLMGCSRSPSVSLSGETAAELVVVAADPAEGSWSRFFQRQLEEADRFDLARMAVAMEKAAGEGRILVVADIGGLPGDAWQDLAGYLRAGHPVVLCGPVSGDPAAGFGLTADGTGLERLAQAYGFTLDRLEHPAALQPPQAADGLYAQSWLVPAPRPPAEADAIRRIPLAAGYAYPGQLRGWPSWWVRAPAADPGQPPVGWVWLAVDAGRESSPAYPWLVEGAVRALRAPGMLAGFPSIAHRMEPGRPLTLDVAWLADPGELRELRVSAEWLAERGEVLRRVVSPPLPAATGAVSLNVGVTPSPDPRSASARLRIQVRSRDDTRAFDQLDRLIKIRTDGIDLPPETWVTAAGPSLLAGRVPFFLFGVDYIPIRTPETGAPPADGGSWLEGYAFDGDAFLRDLDLIQELGMNTLGLACDRPEQAPQLAWVLDELRRRNLKAVVRLGGPGLADSDSDILRALVQRAGLAARSEIAAIELALPAVAEGAFETDAANAWPVWLDWMEDPDPLPWPDARASDDPEIRGKVDRFLRMHIRGRMLDRIALLRELGCPHLVSLRLVAGAPDEASPDRPRLDESLAGPLVDLAAVPGEVLRFRTLDAEAPRFHALYSRGMAGGRPVYWQDAVRDPVPGMTRREQAQNTIEAAFASGSAGWMSGPWFAEASDPALGHLGLVAPDRTWHAEVSILRAYKNRLRQQRPMIRPWREQMFDPILRFEDRAGVTAAWLQRYAGMFEELRPTGFRNDASDWLRRVETGEAGAADARDALAALWKTGALGVSYAERLVGRSLTVPPGRPVVLSLVHLGPSAWDHPDAPSRHPVRLRITGPAGRIEWLDLPEASFGDVVEVAWEPTEPGRHVLQVCLGGGIPVSDVLVADVTR